MPRSSPNVVRSHASNFLAVSALFSTGGTIDNPPPPRGFLCFLGVGEVATSYDETTKRR